MRTAIRTTATLFAAIVLSGTIAQSAGAATTAAAPSAPVISVAGPQPEPPTLKRPGSHSRPICCMPPWNQGKHRNGNVPPPWESRNGNVPPPWESVQPL